jgi:hypothetical protein
VLGLAEGRRFTEVVPPRGDRPSFTDLTTDATFDAPNQMVQHPPLGYVHLVAAEALVRAAPGDLAFDQHLWLLRLVTVALGAAVPVLIARAVRALGGSPNQQLVAALLPLAIPQLGAALGTIGNDVPLVVAGAAATTAAALLLADPHRSGAVLGAAVGLGALTKGFGLALFAMLTVPLLDRPPRWRQAGVALAVAIGVGAWWWVWNLLRYGAVQPHGVPLEDLYGAPLQDGPGFSVWLQETGPVLVDRFWGAFGSFSLHIGLPRWATLAATAVLIGLFARGSVRGGAPVRRLAWAVGLLLASSLAILAWGAFDIFATYGQLLGVQGRYLFATVPGLAVVVAFGFERAKVGTVPRTLVAIAAIQAAGLWQVLDGWWGRPDDGTVDRLRAMAGWSAAPPMLVLVLLGGLLIGGGMCLRRHPPDAVDPGPGAPAPPPAAVPSP